MLLGTTEERKKIRILTIEDEELLREYVCDYLEDIGFVTLQADNGRRGMELIRSEMPDLVLTDLRMPEMNGLDVLAIMQKEFPEMPVVVISGTGTLNDVVQTLKFGAWDYILKPIHDYSILELSVKRVLERKRLLEENRRYRQHLEEEVAIRTQDLIKSTLKFKTLFNLAADAIIIHDPQGNIIDTNQEAIRYSGREREQILKLTIFDLFTETEQDVLREYLRDLNQGKHILFESYLKSGDSSVIPVEVSASLVTMDQTPQILAVARNITERKKAEEERRELEKQIVAAQKMELLGLLASGVAHDFNNVLSALTGYTVLLRSKMQQGSAEVEYLKKINGIIAMGQNIARRITTFVRKGKDELKKVDLHKVLCDTEAMLLPNCRKINIELQLQAVNYHIMGDEAQLQNTFLNLGINARDAMPQGGTLRFTTANIASSENDKDTEEICIEVHDTGIGMDQQTMAKIFDPLFTTKDGVKGTGLGLTSVLYCIKNLHGKIDVKSTPGKGTSFQIRFPLHGDLSN